MATAYNSTIKLYTKVPLVKGGTEVLYLSQGAAEGALAGFLKATYNEYYFVRDNRRAVQIDATFGDCDGVNYISFSNNSHGGKIFFAFVDEIVYINDNCTEIRFTIDPFPTYLGDTKIGDAVYVVRNTDVAPTRTSNMMKDYVPQSIKKRYNNLYHFERGPFTEAVVYFCDTGDRIRIGNSGILVDELTPSIVQSIQENGGVIIGAYMNIFGTSLTPFARVITPLPDITFNPLTVTSGYRFPKLNTGIYTDLLLITSNGTKQYDIEDFTDPTSVTFGALICVIPSPMVFIYPKRYRGVADNVSEGMAIKVPSLPITANATYTDAQFLSDAKNTAIGAIGGAVAGAAKGGVYGAALGAITGLAGGLANMGFNEYATQFQAPTVIGRGEPILTPDNRLVADFVAVSPQELSMIEEHFNYYGYAVNGVLPKARINTENNAFLQTGGVWLSGSEADEELNARLMAGIKIKKSF